MPLLPSTMGLAGLLFWAGQTVNAWMPNATLALARTKGTAVWPLSGLGVPRYQRKRHISAGDMSALLDFHNHIRASVHPPAANMEYMCGSINIWGNTWHHAVYLVCNYAIKGNWIGEAPYKMGRPCSACPPSSQGTCISNMCFSGLKSNRLLWF
ncbi:peptidase inhibitor R3HDML [Leptonychotes weddellii]|uniref:Peptidase inhibitor R3HDML n=1 Tax=Leptonychotes weddellii TaxID=9713 RepID=A0A2U3XSY2_LEPWE|nr:peptidase inhibitor R3HDML [Leptonychotes weddellii]